MKSGDSSMLFTGIDTIYESDIDDDNLSGAENSVVLERRRKSHTEAEQRRRNAIKKGFESLRELVYPLKSNAGSIRLSKLSILNKAVSEIKKLLKESNQKERDVSKLKSTVETLRIVNSYYRDKMKSLSTIPYPIVKPVEDSVKFRIFQMFADSLFTSFDSSVVIGSFPEMASQILKWLEDNCKQETLSSFMNSVLPPTFSLNYNAPHRASIKVDENRHSMEGVIQETTSLQTTDWNYFRDTSRSGWMGCPKPSHPTAPAFKGILDSPISHQQPYSVVRQPFITYSAVSNEEDSSGFHGMFSLNNGPPSNFLALNSSNLTTPPSHESCKSNFEENQPGEVLTPVFPSPHSFDDLDPFPSRKPTDTHRMRSIDELAKFPFIFMDHSTICPRRSSLRQPPSNYVTQAPFGRLP